MARDIATFLTVIWNYSQSFWVSWKFIIDRHKQMTKKPNAQMDPKGIIFHAMAVHLICFCLNVLRTARKRSWYAFHSPYSQRLCAICQKRVSFMGLSLYLFAFTHDILGDVELLCMQCILAQSKLANTKPNAFDVAVSFKLNATAICRFTWIRICSSYAFGWVNGLGWVGWSVDRVFFLFISLCFSFVVFFVFCAF